MFHSFWFVGWKWWITLNLIKSCSCPITAYCLFTWVWWRLFSGIPSRFHNSPWLAVHAWTMRMIQTPLKFLFVVFDQATTYQLQTVAFDWTHYTSFLSTGWSHSLCTTCVKKRLVSSLSCGWSQAVKRLPALDCATLTLCACMVVFTSHSGEKAPGLTSLYLRTPGLCCLSWVCLFVLNWHLYSKHFHGVKKQTKTWSCLCYLCCETMWHLTSSQFVADTSVSCSAGLSTSVLRVKHWEPVLPQPADNSYDDDEQEKLPQRRRPVW